MFREKKHSAHQTPPPGQVLKCSFCNKSQRAVKKLIAGPNVQICDECVDICIDILVEAKKDAVEAATVDGQLEVAGSTWPLPGTILLCGLCRMPSPFENSLTIAERRVMCAGCVLAFEATLGERETFP